MLFFYLSLSALTLTTVTGHYIDFGACPSQTVEQNFKFQQYMGKWFQIARYNAIYASNGKCTYGEYNQTSSSTMNVHYQQNVKDTGKVSVMDGSAKLTNSSANEGKFTLTLYATPYFNITAPQWVLSTDYNNYAILYNCKTVFFVFRQTNFMIFTRQRSPSTETLGYIEQSLKNHNMEYSNLTPIDQTNCN